MWQKLIKGPVLLDAAMITSLTYLTALALEQLKPGFFSNSLDITYILVLAVILIILAALIKPRYSSSRLVSGYYTIWCLALGLVFVKLVKNWLTLSFLQALVLVGCMLLILILARYYQTKYSHE